MQEQPGLLPIALDGPLGDLLHPGDLNEREAAEELEVHDLGQPRVDGGQLLERLRELLEVGGGAGAASATSPSIAVISKPPPRFCAWRRRT